LVKVDELAFVDWLAVPEDEVVPLEDDPLAGQVPVV